MASPGSSYSRVRRYLSIAALALAFCHAAPGTACPGALFQAELPVPLTGQRQGLRLFVKEGGGTKGAAIFRSIPLQVDPIDANGRLVFFEPTDNFMARDTDRQDLLTFRAEDFGQRFDARTDKLPCRGGLLYELKSANGFAYLTNCSRTAKTSQPPLNVNFDVSAHKLTSPNYKYIFNPDNYMQFQSISFKGANGAWGEIASDSRLLIRADVKNFFTMSFDSRQIESRLEERRQGPIGELARLSFYLRILFFRISMSLSTDVGFYDDAGRIPMMVSIPINAYDYLRPASGILYSWVLSPVGRDGEKRIKMPILDVGMVRSGFKNLANLGRKYCGKDDCTFQYSVVSGGKVLSMDLGIRRELVERGFFPMYVDDVSRFREAMGWDVETVPGVKRSGMYFEVSGLPEGGHPWDFWLRLGDERDKVCPVPVHFERI